ncbi:MULTISPECIES: FtsW/RodA/SpoVE family cell cycle protein [unclassified Campylobacter]|uniref:FtsW/RodA/SpoVE family cell cycle protein n=1 Tax=unclassified Campylobacter TaxID=2593542 RepID=UPI001BDADDED|nr:MULTISPECIES: FtsW/RodA/SpoVE family cell cycle protein [unclassified Campylobacter]MBZ7978109.1 FtsW/RodA/SpoVE family cell cycle protein [Campylobacter sp. RM12654]MBZ7981402.1 FtsW/RodA/SpoVE family cell cycle protein [Campylobacter sp. RM12640]MBZ7983808.1 FtsW/RodA/SpoVE family cell cycle protein [Campylobacter sp. RM12647]MBZ7989002.1 FtsW/RodA/SpoVE family cell cycle protein [Campylobacter sp. RM12635]MBZ8007781.1 FtsW/RodA/SpoVE family cell cycle protein [Campylobacter sp. RM9334]
MIKTHLRIFEIVLILMMFSIVFVFSMGFFNYGGQKSPYGFLFSQTLFAIVGVLIIFTFQLISEKACYRILYVILGCSVLACFVLPFLPASLVVETKGARRWIRLFGFSIAPLEFVKISFIAFLAFTYSRKIDENKRKFLQDLRLLAPTIAIYCFIFGYAYITQNDLGQCVVTAVTLFIMALAAGVRFRNILYLFLAAIAAGISLIAYNPRRLERGLEWWGSIQDFVLPIFPESIQESLKIAHSSEPYQISHSLNAITNGDLLGQGFGLGVFKLGFLSEVHTDFILSGIAEEIGFLGFLFVSLLFGFLIASVLKLSTYMKNKQNYLFCIGYGVCIMATFLMNIGGIISLIPLKGIAVPFLSYGGSSMLANSIAIGILLSIFKNTGENINLENKE